jgi:drug/metabolite transporter (DMT)-like permease
MSVALLAAKEERVLSGALYMLLAAFLFAVMGFLIRDVAVGLNNSMIVFLRNIFGLIFLAPILLKQRANGLATSRPLTHLLRTCFGLAAMYFFFYTIPRLSVAEAMLLNFCVPLYMPLIAWLLLKEKTNGYTAVAITIGFAGLVFIVGAKELSVSSGAITGLLSGVCAAIALTFVRRLSSTEPASRIVFYFAFFSLLISAAVAVFDWQTLNREQWLSMLCIGGLATAAQLSITKGFAAAPAAKVSVFNYAAAIWAALGSWLFWGVVPTVNMVIGAALIIAAGGLVAWRGSVDKKAADLPIA